MLASMELAARNNAEWCDLVCRGHGTPTVFDEAMWVTARRSPPMYPDAVTLLPSARAEDVLARIDVSAGCSVKDSFATLDLTGHGFRVLFTAEWIHRPPPPDAPPTTWREVSRPAELAVWSAAHSGTFHGLPIVGYEHGADLDLAYEAGFAGAGPLRVWIKD